MYRQRKEIRTDSKKESKSGQRKQKVATRIALSKKLRVPASKLKGKTFEELMDLSKLVNSGDIEGARELLEVQKIAPRISDKEMRDQEEVEDVMEEMLGMLDITESRPEGFDEPEIVEEKMEEAGERMREAARKRGQRIVRPSRVVRQVEPLLRDERLLSNFLEGVRRSEPLVYEEPQEGKYDSPKRDIQDEALRNMQRLSGNVAEAVLREDDYDLRETQLMETQLMKTRQMTRYTPVSNIGVDDNIFRDNSIREINANLTGLEMNSTIPIRTQMSDKPPLREVIDDPEEEMKIQNSDYVDPEVQNDELEGEADEWIHADPNDLSTRNVNSYILAENNQYSESQKNILRRGEANRQIQNRINKGNLDLGLGEAQPQEGERDDERKYGDQDDIGGGLGDVGFDEDPEIVEGGARERELIENEIERRLIQPRTRWVGNRGVTADFQRQAVADRIGNSLKNSQQLNYMRKTPIPWKRPSRTYANNSVGLIRNSNRSMVLAVNRLEP